MQKNEKEKLAELIEQLFYCKGRIPEEKMVIAWCKQLMQHDFTEVEKAINAEIKYGDGFLNMSKLYNRMPTAADRRSAQNYKDMNKNGKLKK